MTTKSMLLAILATMSISVAADAQTKFYMRANVAPKTAAPAPPAVTCGAPVAGQWLQQKTGKPGISIVASTSGHATAQTAQNWCNQNSGLSADNMCLWQPGASTYLVLNAMAITVGGTLSWGATGQ